tara:strand:+ start:72 stop:311 length:240 start_codon:yes stop_codon:yes gene_type:complete
MSCKHCPHCIEKAKQEDYENRKVYVETCRKNLYIPNPGRKMNIEQAEQYLSKLHGFDKWYRLSFDIPIDEELYKKWSKK